MRRYLVAILALAVAFGGGAPAAAMAAGAGVHCAPSTDAPPQHHDRDRGDAGTVVCCTALCHPLAVIAEAPQPAAVLDYPGDFPRDGHGDAHEPEPADPPPRA